MYVEVGGLVLLNSRPLKRAKSSLPRGASSKHISLAYYENNQNVLIVPRNANARTQGTSSSMKVSEENEMILHKLFDRRRQYLLLGLAKSNPCKDVERIRQKRRIDVYYHPIKDLGFQRSQRSKGYRISMIQRRVVFYCEYIS